VNTDRKIVFPGYENLSFSSTKEHFKFKTAVTIGACRSGKTTLCMLLSTCNFVEFAEDPWIAKILPLIKGLGANIEDDIVKELFLNFITELWNDIILLRAVSFRPDDTSTIWNQKNIEEIFYRFSKIGTRKDVSKFKKKSLLLINLSEVLPFIRFFLDVMPKTKLIHIIRNATDVAHDCYFKHWFSDQQLLRPVKALPYKVFHNRGQSWHIPWWVNLGEEELFLSYNEYSRCIYYWCQNVQAGLEEIDRVNDKKCYTVFYEEMVRRPEKVLSEISKYLSITPGPLTGMAISEVKKRDNISLNIVDQKINSELQLRIDYINSLMNNYR
jgi:hypothetical protein